jgi:hypothetical protein
VRERDAAEAARQAARKDVADRIYERLKLEQEEAQRAADEEQELVNLLRQVGRCGCLAGSRRAWAAYLVAGGGAGGRSARLARGWGWSAWCASCQLG